MFVKNQLESGRFNNVSEVVRAGLRLLEEEKLREIRHRDLKAAIQAGVDSPDAGSIRDVVARNRARRGKRGIQEIMRVRVSRLAEMDLAEITDFIALDNPERAWQFEEELLECTQKIALAPLG